MKTTAKQYAQVLYDLTRGKSQDEADAVVSNFAEKLRKDRNLKMFERIVVRFEAIYNQENGVINVKVTSARELTEDQIEKVTEFVKSKYEAKEVVVENIADADVIGGVVIKVGDDVIDSSVGGRIEKLKSDLLK
ncbi:ATP synthase F1 subunit delta [Patescibacteria group bacterium]